MGRDVLFKRDFVTKCGGVSVLSRTDVLHTLDYVFRGMAGSAVL